MKSEQETLSEDVIELLENSLGGIERFEFVSSGLVHWVWRVLDQQGEEFYLKLRGERFRKMPDISCNPEDIRFEAQAIQVCSHLAPSYFPKFVASWPEHGALIVTSVLEPSELMLPRFKARSVPTADVRRCGQSIRDIHERLEIANVRIRGVDEDAYYNNNLFYRLGRSGGEEVDWLISELKSLPRRLIYGDFSPKNLGFRGGQLRIFDLDTVHLGNVAFDVGFFLGHLIIHGIENSLSTASLVRDFLDGYGSMSTQEFGQPEKVVNGVALGTILYRLDNPVVPYASELDYQEKESLKGYAKIMLRSGEIDIDELIRKIN